MRDHIFGLLFLLCITSCGYMDDDGIIYERQITGNFYLQQQARDENVRFVYKYDPNSSMVIISGCNRLTFDSLRNIILVEDYQNEHNSSFYLIRIMDPNTNSPQGAFSKKEIYKSTFSNYRDTCRNCFTWETSLRTTK